MDAWANLAGLDDDLRVSPKLIRSYTAAWMQQIAYDFTPTHMAHMMWAFGQMAEKDLHVVPEAGGLLRTSTRPTLTLLLLIRVLRASV